MPTENEIRDYLGSNPTTLEYGLRTIETNYHLPNAVGSRGFVDLLARDPQGRLVVVELKRSDSAAREAIHEVLKYVDLLRRERNIPADQIRAIVASTSWHELAVPFSLATRHSPVPLEGRVLHVEDAADSFSVVAAMYEPLDATFEPSLSEVRVEIRLNSESEIQAAWEQAADRLEDAGVHDLVGVPLVHSTGSAVLHLGLGNIQPGDPGAVALYGSPTVTPNDDRAEPETPEDSDYELQGNEVASERRAAVSLVQYLPSAKESHGGNLQRLLSNANWRALPALHNGAFVAQADLVDQKQVLAEMSGRTRDGRIVTKDVASPAHYPTWSALRTKVNETLEHIPSWRKTLNIWLDEMQHQNPKWQVSVHIFDPKDFLSAFVFDYMADLSDMLARVLCSAYPTPIGDQLPTEGRLVHGQLMWNGETPDVQSAFEATYATGDLWWLDRTRGELAEKDLMFLKSLGLTYELLEFDIESNDGFLLEVAKGSLERSPGSDPDWWGPQRQSVVDFLEIHRDQLDLLATELKTGATKPDEFGDMLFMIGGALDDLDGIDRRLP